MKFGYFCNTTNWTHKPYDKLLDETSLEYFKLKMQLTTGQLPTHRMVRQSKKNIALIKTIINEKRLSDGTE